MMNANLFIILCFLKLCLCNDSDKNLFPSLPVAPIKAKTELCKADSILFLENLNNLTLWAYKMWDATARSTIGSLQGNNYQLGDWDECKKAKPPFKTQFCLTQITANVSWLEPNKDPYALEMDPFGSVLKRILSTNDVSQITKNTVYMGWCVPASCTLEDLQTALDDQLNHAETYLIQHNVTYSGKMYERMCQRQGEGKPFDILDGAFCIILAFFVFVVLIATAYEFKLENELTEKEKQNFQKHMGQRILMGFSARKNFLDLTKADESDPALRPLYGVRTVSIFMIIAGHRFGTFSSGPVINFDAIEEKYRSLGETVVFHGDLFVDSFFVLSGLLVTYGLMIQYKKKYIHPLFIIFFRYMRLTPLYAFVIMYYVTLLNHIGSGPLWKLVVYQESNDCKANWWTNLLYINNYVNEPNLNFGDLNKDLLLYIKIRMTSMEILETCMAQSWYLACDFHYFIIAIFLILILLRNKKLGFALFSFLFILSMLVPFAIVLIYKAAGMVRFYPEVLKNPKQDADFILTYIKSHTRATSYCVGMIAGYIYYKLKDSEKRLSKFKSHTLALVSILLIIISMPVGGIMYNPYHEYNVIEHALFAGLNRLLWSIGTIGLLLTASYGHTTIIQKVLSWSPFIPLSRLVYGAFLIHLSLQFRVLGVTLGSQTFDPFTLLSWTLGEIVLAFAIALILYLIIETPMRKLFKELFMGSRQTAQPSGRGSRHENGINSISRRENDSRL